MAYHRSSQQLLSFPGEEARETWACGPEGSWKLVELAANDGVMGVEALAFDSAPFWSLNHEEAPDETVALRWEGLGMSNQGGSRLWLHWPVMHKAKQVLVGTLALTEEFSGWKHFLQGRFEPSVLMLPLPANGIAMWKELGRHVVAFTREAKLLHVVVLTARSLDVDAAFEVRDLCAALQTHGFISSSEVGSIHVWTGCETDFVPQLACLFEDAAVVKETRPDPRPPAVSGGLLPLQVAVQRQQQQRRQNQLLMLAAAALVYLCFFGAWWLRLEWRASRLNHADAAMSSAQPEIDLVREAQNRWQEMEAAINPDLYPVELFHQIVSLLPEEGIRLKEFQVDGSKLIVSGEATTVNQALAFKGQLTACKPLQRYAWNFPLPSIREDNRAEFRAEGTLTGGPVHEGQ
jgi:Tfp pilus assembly protein PilN